MNKTAKMMITVILSLALLPIAAVSEETDPGATSDQRSGMTPEQRRAAWESLSEEEKQATREEMRARREHRRAEWEAMTPEERDARRAEMREKWESMTPEEREAMKERRKRVGGKGKHRHAEKTPEE